MDKDPVRSANGEICTQAVVMRNNQVEE